MRILLAIDPKKDVDGFHPMNTGNLWNGRPQMVPCTPAGIMEILREYNVELEGKTAVIIGRSNIVGKPMAQLLLEKNAFEDGQGSHDAGVDGELVVVDLGEHGVQVHEGAGHRDVEGQDGVDGGRLVAEHVVGQLVDGDRKSVV